MELSSLALLPLGAVICLTPWIAAGPALLLGVILAVAFGNPYLDHTRRWTPRLLAWSVVGLGGGMNLGVVARIGTQGIGYTILGISGTLLLGTLLGRVLKTERDASILITAGTAICGGSAIAAVAPTIGARNHHISVSLGTVFLLNATALFIFPWVGHHFRLTETQFGLWSALAIHDTSSVVGATIQYGSHALEVGTTVKLARALWIVPLTFGLGALVGHTTDSAPGAPSSSAPVAPSGSAPVAPSGSAPGTKAARPRRPWFILGFLAAAAIVTWIPALQPAGHLMEAVAKRILFVTLFLIGGNLTRATLRSVGVAPFLQGLLLWAAVASATLGAILAGWIH